VNALGVRKGREMLIILVTGCVGFLVILAVGLVLLRLAIGGDQNAGVFTNKPQTRVTGAVRSVTGLYVRMPERTAVCQAERAPDESL
jgi:hypothetical protein